MPTDVSTTINLGLDVFQGLPHVNRVQDGQFEVVMVGKRRELGLGVSGAEAELATIPTHLKPPHHQQTVAGGVCIFLRICRSLHIKNAITGYADCRR